MRETLILTLSRDADGRESFEQSFDCSKFPNLEELKFGFGWNSGGLLWISMALSTLRPSTSPRLSTIQLTLHGLPSAARPTGYFVDELLDDLQRIEDEVTRIDQEFGGAVNLIVPRNLWF